MRGGLSSLSNLTVLFGAFAFALWSFGTLFVALDQQIPFCTAFGLFCAITGGICYAIIAKRWKCFKIYHKLLSVPIILVASLWIVWLISDAVHGYMDGFAGK